MDGFLRPQSTSEQFPLSTDCATTELAVQLIRMASVTPCDGGCQALIAERLERLGFTIEALNFGEVSNLFARRGRGQPHLAFIGHTDVVPAGEPADWRFPPFSAAVADGFVHGRGAADMKGSIAAMITACERAFAPTGGDFSGSLSFLLTSDEEGAAVDGTRYVLERLVARGECPRYCLVGEPTSEMTLGDTIKIGRRGSLTGWLTIRGRQGHVAYPQLADNPVHHSGALISALADCEWRDGDDAFPDTTLQIANVKAGVGAENVIPGEMLLNFNIRFSPVQTVTALKSRIENLCQDLGLDFDIRWNPASDPYRSAGDHLAELAAAAIADVLDIKPKRSTSGGTSDGRFAAAYGAEVVELGPLNATIHQTNERVSIQDLGRLSQIYQRLLERFSAAAAKVP